MPIGVISNRAVQDTGRVPVVDALPAFAAIRFGSSGSACASECELKPELFLGIGLGGSEADDDLLRSRLASEPVNTKSFFFGIARVRSQKMHTGVGHAVLSVFAQGIPKALGEVIATMAPQIPSRSAVCAAWNSDCRECLVVAYGVETETVARAAGQAALRRRDNRCFRGLPHCWPIASMLKPGARLRSKRSRSELAVTRTML